MPKLTPAPRKGTTAPVLKSLAMTPYGGSIATSRILRTGGERFNHNLSKNGRSSETSVEIVTTTYTFAFSILADVATVGAERMSEKIGKASLRDAAIGTGVAVDKMLALTGQTPAFQMANVVMPSEAEREERRAMHDKLDEIARRLADAQTPSE